MTRSMEDWFAEYAESHENETNQKIHYICVPAIFFSIVGMIMSIPHENLIGIARLNNPLFENYATPLLILVLLFYLRLSFRTFLFMTIFSILCLAGNYYLGSVVPLFPVSLAIFVLAWIGQFYGHKIEGRKPSFFQDIQFLLIGPAWVFEKLTN